MHEDELLDLVNDQDQVIGTILRSEYGRMEEEKLGYIRCVELLIQNDEGKFWIPTRTAHKKIAPNGLDYSAGGHVGAGQSYDEAMQREIEEELGLKLLPSDLQFIKMYAPNTTLYFRALYIYHSNETPNFNPDDFVSGEWLTLEEIKSKLDAGVAAKLSLIETIDDLAAIARQQS